MLGGDVARHENFPHLIHDVALLHSLGVRLVLIHGSRAQIDERLAVAGIDTVFHGDMFDSDTYHGGLRVTDAETMEVVEMVLGGKINREIVELIHRGGGRAVGLTGSDGAMIRARQRDRDLGRVGEVVAVDPQAIEAVTSAGFIPVIAGIGADEEGTTYNVNADEVAGALAAALRAEKLMLLTDVEGLLDGSGALIPQLTIEETRKLTDDGVIRGGMIPKVACCVEALRQGVKRTHIVDGRIRHAILLEMFTDEGGAGTLLTA